MQSLSLVVVLSCSNGRPWHEMRRHPRPLPNITQFTFWLKYPLRQHLKEGHQLGVPEQDPFSSPPLTNAPHAPLLQPPCIHPFPPSAPYAGTHCPTTPRALPKLLSNWPGVEPRREVGALLRLTGLGRCARISHAQLLSIQNRGRDRLENVQKVLGM